MTAANRIAVEVQRAIGPLFDRRVLESGPFVTPGDHAGVSEGGRSHGRSREQGEAKKCAHGFNRGARKAGTPQLLTMIAAGQVLALPEARRAGITGSKERGKRAERSCDLSRSSACQRQSPEHRVAGGHQPQRRVAHHPSPVNWLAAA